MMSVPTDSATFSTVISPMIPAVTCVRHFQRETHDTFTLKVDPPRTGQFTFRPGQFNMLYVFGVGEVPISISGDPGKVQEIDHTIRAVGSVTNALAILQPGSILGIRGPFGSEWPLDLAAGCDVILVAGGIGFAPLRPAWYHLLHHRNELGRLALLYGARTPADLLYQAELRDWGQQPECEVHVTVDQGDATWSGPIGVVTTLFPRVDFDPERTIGMICGPEIMMRFVVREFQKRGVPDDHLYVSLERNFQCGIGMCGHCQLGPNFVCKEGPVFRYDRIKRFFNIREA